MYVNMILFYFIFCDHFLCQLLIIAQQKNFNGIYNKAACIIISQHKGNCATVFNI